MDVPLYNLFGNLDIKGYRNILGIVMMSKDFSICFIVVRGTKYYDLIYLNYCPKNNFGGHFEFHG